MKGSWRDSDVGLAYKNLDPQAPYIKDDRKLNKDMSKFVANGSGKKPSEKSRKEKAKTGNIQTCCAECATTEPIPHTTELDDILVPVTLFHREAKSRSLTAVALLDTGSRYRDNRRELNTISRSVVKKIVEVGGVLYEDPARLCFGSSCKTYKNAIDLNVSLLFDPSTNDVMDLGNLTFQVTENLPDSEVIIGWKTLKEHRVICRCDNHSVAKKIVAPLKRVMSYQQFKFNNSKPTYDDSETASVNDHTDTESVDSAVPSAQFSRKGYVCSINAAAPVRVTESGDTRHISELLNILPMEIANQRNKTIWMMRYNQTLIYLGTILYRRIS